MILSDLNSLDSHSQSAGFSRPRNANVPQPLSRLRQAAIRVNTTPQIVMTSNSESKTSSRPPSGVLTPPDSPRRPQCIKSDTSSTANQSPKTPAASMDRMAREPMLKEFCAEIFDYELQKSQILGSGRWSTVFLGHPISSTSKTKIADSSMLSPPPSPIQLRFPELFAVKVAAGKSSIAALRHEATILTHLSSISDYHNHIVPFYGYDFRREAIVFSALPTNLESIFKNDLNDVDEAQRIAKLSAIIPKLFRSLTSSLAWLHAADAIHADIKPANILLRPDCPIGPDQSILDVPFTPLLADFTASFINDSPSSDTNPSTVGGGTYDFVAPELLTRPFPAPSKSSDVYALAISLLTIITGVSPFNSAEGNRYRLLDMIKAGKPLDFALRDPQSEKRLCGVSAGVKGKGGVDLLRVLELGLMMNSLERVNADEWSKML